MTEAEVYVFPMTPQQRRLWTLDRLRPGDPAYNVPLAFALDGALDTAALAASLTALIGRHEALRTTFGELDGELVQLVHAAQPFVLGTALAEELQDPRDATRPLSTEPAIEPALAQRLLADSRRPFDLVRGPLIRAQLYRRNPSEHLLLLELHHIICDRWSLGVIAREVIAGYDAEVTGKKSAALGAPAYQYGDYAEWLRDRLAPDRVREHVAYWRDALAGLPPSWQLPRFPCRTLWLHRCSRRRERP